MSRTLHRRDISRDELYLLARFCHALQTIERDNGRLPWHLGLVEIWLPVWYQLGKGWEIAAYKPFKKEAIGLEVWAFRLVCRYLCVKEAVLVRTLYRLSILAVIPRLNFNDRPKFRMDFFGQPISLVGCAEPSHEFGFVLERRRCEGNFK